MKAGKIRALNIFFTAGLERIENLERRHKWPREDVNLSIAFIYGCYNLMIFSFIKTLNIWLLDPNAAADDASISYIRAAKEPAVIW